MHQRIPLPKLTQLIEPHLQRRFSHFMPKAAHSPTILLLLNLNNQHIAASCPLRQHSDQCSDIPFMRVRVSLPALSIHLPKHTHACHLRGDISVTRPAGSRSLIRKSEAGVSSTQTAPPLLFREVQTLSIPPMAPFQSCLQSEEDLFAERGEVGDVRWEERDDFEVVLITENRLVA